MEVLIVVGLMFLTVFILSYLPYVYHTHIYTNSRNPLSPAAWQPKTFFISQYAGSQERALIFQGAHVCGVCVIRLVVSFHFLCLYSFLPPVQLITTSLFFPFRSSTFEKGELHPSISHSFFSNPVVTNIFSFFLYVLHLWTDWTLGNSLFFTW